MLNRPSSRRKSKKEQIGLNLVPILDTMVTLIAFLLFTTSFIALVSIQSPFPEISKDQNEKTITEKPLQLTITVREKEIEIWSPFDRIPSKILPHTLNGQPDLKSLHEALIVTKQQFPNEKTAVLLPQSSTNYDTLIAIMDTVRLLEPGDTPIFQNVSSQVQGTDTSQTVKVLFPEVVFGNLLGDS